MTTQQAAMYLYAVSQNIVGLEAAVLGSNSNNHASGSNNNAAFAAAAAVAEGRGGGGGMMGGFWGPSPFDFFYYRPYYSRYYYSPAYGNVDRGSQGRDPEEMGFLESVL